MTRYRTVFISDIHLGSKGCQADKLCEFLKNLECSSLYLVGDIIDGWKIQQNRMRWKKSHTKVLRLLLNMKNTRIVYVAGNHDEFLRSFLKFDLTFANIEVCNSAIYTDLLNRKYLVVHGDMFDGITRLAPWLSFLGDRAYDLLLSVNTSYNAFRHRLGFGYWSLSQWLKHKVKKAVNFIFEFEKTITTYAAKRNFDGVICGHIHTPSISNINGTWYMNDGDWVESLSALVEHEDGTWEIIYASNSDGQPSGSN